MNLFGRNFARFYDFLHLKRTYVIGQCKHAKRNNNTVFGISEVIVELLVP